MPDLITNPPGSRKRQLALPGLLRSLVTALVILALPPGAGVALLGLVTALAWRLPQLLAELACRRPRRSTQAAGPTARPCPNR